MHKRTLSSLAALFAFVLLAKSDRVPAQSVLPYPCGFVSGYAARTASIPCPPVTAGYQATVLADSPYVYYRLNESSGTVAHDLGSCGCNATYTGSGTQHDGSLMSGDPTSNSYSPVGSSSNFVVAGGPLNSYPTGNQITVEAWVQPASGDVSASFDVSAIVNDKDPLTNTNSDWWAAQVHGDTTSGHIQQQWATGSETDVTANGSLVAGTDYYVVVTYDKGTGDRQLWLNGTQIVSVIGGPTFFPAWPTGTNTTPPVMIGCMGSSATANICDATNPFSLNGKVSEVAWYSSILSPTRIAAHYAFH